MLEETKVLWPADPIDDESGNRHNNFASEFPGHEADLAPLDMISLTQTAQDTIFSYSIELLSFLHLLHTRARGGLHLALGAKRAVSWRAGRSGNLIPSPLQCKNWHTRGSLYNRSLNTKTRKRIKEEDKEWRTPKRTKWRADAKKNYIYIYIREGASLERGWMSRTPHHANSHNSSYFLENSRTNRPKETPQYTHGTGMNTFSSFSFIGRRLVI